MKLSLLYKHNFLLEPAKGGKIPATNYSLYRAIWFVSSRIFVEFGFLKEEEKRKFCSMINILQH